MNKILQKIKEGALFGVGIIAVVGFTGLSYAAITWVTQSDVNPGDTLSASSWNDMVNNQNYLKQEVEGIDLTPLVQKNGDTMAGELNMGTNKITALGTPTATTDATNKAYVDSISASTSTVAIPQIKYTPTQYNGNLGGISGANSKCVSAFGTGWRMLTEGDLMSFNYNHGAGSGWVTNYNNSSCSNWAGAPSSRGPVFMASDATTPVKTTGYYCRQSFSISCTNLP